MVNRCHRETRLDQLNAPAIDDVVLGRCGHGHSPAKVMRNANSHAAHSAKRARSGTRTPARLAARRMARSL